MFTGKLFKKKSLRNKLISRGKKNSGEMGIRNAIYVSVLSVVLTAILTFAISKYFEERRQRFELFKETWVGLTEVVNYCSLFEISNTAVINERQIFYRIIDQHGRIVDTRPGPVTQDSFLINLPAIINDSISRLQFNSLLSKWLANAAILDYEVYRQVVLLKQFIVYHPFPSTADSIALVKSGWLDTNVVNAYFSHLTNLRIVAEQKLNRD